MKRSLLFVSLLLVLTTSPSVALAKSASQDDVKKLQAEIDKLTADLATLRSDFNSLGTVVTALRKTSLFVDEQTFNTSQTTTLAIPANTRFILITDQELTTPSITPPSTAVLTLNNIKGKAILGSGASFHLDQSQKNLVAEGTGATTYIVRFVRQGQ